MRRELTDISFAEWVTYVFDHPASDSGIPKWARSSEALIDRPWYLESDSEWWNPSRQPEVTVAYLTNLFENAPHVLTPFSDAQIHQGFNFLVNNLYSAHMLVLFNPAVPWSERKHCISSLYTLFERFFAPRCFSHLSHLDISEVSPLNGMCYMWWDMLHYYGNPADPDGAEVGAACLEVKQMTLDLDSDACRESALHGLSHWQYAYPQHMQAIQTIIDEFLDRHPGLRPELKAYARTARKGLVL